MSILSIFKQRKLAKHNSGSRRGSNHSSSCRVNYEVSVKINLSNHLIAFSFIVICSLFLLLRACTTLTYKIETTDLLQSRSSFARRFLIFPSYWLPDEPYSEVLTCDRSHLRTDVCVAKGDVRVRGYSVVVNAAAAATGQGRTGTAAPGIKVVREEKIKPYTRKWEESVMNTIDEVSIVVLQNQSSSSEINQIEKKSAAVSVEAVVGDIDRIHDAATPVQKKVMSYDSEYCDVRHDVPAVLFSTGGYTGNVYHEFNDGIIPLFITTEKYKGEVVLLLLEYHNWWLTKYAEILSQITNYPAVDLANDTRVHCFREVTVGLRIHGELTIDETVKEGVSMKEFREMLHSAYLPRLQNAEKKAMEKEKMEAMAMANVSEFRENEKQESVEIEAVSASPADNIAMVDMASESNSSIASSEEINTQSPSSSENRAPKSENRVPISDLPERVESKTNSENLTTKNQHPISNEDTRLGSMETQHVLDQEGNPIKLLILSRNKPRAILNQDKVIKLAQEIGFKVSILSPTPTMEMVDLYWSLSTCDVMLGVHGAAMTHLLFMRAHPNPATFIQVVPLGTQWAAATYYGEPAERLGLDYVEYSITPQESSLSESYAPDDPVLIDPDTVNARGWGETKRIYLDSQNVTLDLDRVKRVLTRAYLRAIVQRSKANL